MKTFFPLFRYFFKVDFFKSYLWVLVNTAKPSRNRNKKVVHKYISPFSFLSWALLEKVINLGYLLNYPLFCLFLFSSSHY